MGNITEQKRMDTYAIARGRCWYCGLKLDLFDNECKNYMTIDHIIPRAKGGTLEFDNIVPACKPCNSEKGDLSIEEFRVKVALSAAYPGDRINFNIQQLKWLKKKFNLDLGVSTEPFYGEKLKQEVSPAPTPILAKPKTCSHHAKIIKASPLSPEESVRSELIVELMKRQANERDFVPSWDRPPECMPVPDTITNVFEARFASMKVIGYFGIDTRTKNSYNKPVPSNKRHKWLIGCGLCGRFVLMSHATVGKRLRTRDKNLCPLCGVVRQETLPGVPVAASPVNPGVAAMIKKKTENRVKIIQWYKTHPGGDKKDCAKDLSISAATVKNHLDAMKAA